MRAERLVVAREGIGERRAATASGMFFTAAEVGGATVTVVDEDTEEEKAYQIVGETEADVKSGRVSLTSPIARALIGKFGGDVVEVQTPGGRREYEILDVRYE